MKINPEHFYIRDCNDKIIGNLNGYKTMRGASAQTHNKKSKIYETIWANFYKFYDANPELEHKTINSIVTGEILL
jgi:hypothetical protein